MTPEKITHNKKIGELQEIYKDFIKLGQIRNSDISFSELFMQDHLGWDTYIKYYFLTQGLNKNLFALTAFYTRKHNAKIKYPKNYECNLLSIRQTALVQWESAPSIPILSHGMLEKPSELMLDLSWYDIKTYKMILGVEIEQSRNSEDIRLKDIIFDFSKLLYVNSELKVMISFPWQQQTDYLVKTMNEIVSKVSTIDDDCYLIINISEDKNRGKVRNRQLIDYEIAGYILSNKNEIQTLEKCLYTCLWKKQ